MIYVCRADYNLDQWKTLSEWYSARPANDGKCVSVITLKTATNMQKSKKKIRKSTLKLTNEEYKHYIGFPHRTHSLYFAFNFVPPFSVDTF